MAKMEAGMEKKGSTIGLSSLTDEKKSRKENELQRKERLINTVRRTCPGHVRRLVQPL